MILIKCLINNYVKSNIFSFRTTILGDLNYITLFLNIYIIAFYLFNKLHNMYFWKITLYISSDSLLQASSPDDLSRLLILLILEKVIFY